MWSTPSYDDKLGWAFLPMGGQTPDFWGGFRRPSSDEFGSSVVAIDMILSAGTGGDDLFLLDADAGALPGATVK